MEIKLREYQREAIEKIEKLWSEGHNRLLLSAPTGSGKGVILSYIMETYPWDCIFVVRGRSLVDQGSRRLSCDHGVFMAGHKKYDPKQHVQVVSVDTMHARKEYPSAGLIVIDEAHMCGCESYREMMAHYPDAKVLAVTATPWQKEGIRHVAERVVKTCTIESLIEQGFLVPPKYFAPHRPNLKGVKQTGGEYNGAQLEQVMCQEGLVAPIIETCQKNLRDGAAFLCFTSSVLHSQTLTKRFCEAGIPAEHLDAKTKQDVRLAVLERHKSGTTRVVCNVGILTVGVDMPWITDIIDAAPTLSLIRYVQKLGRGTRLYEGKTHFNVWDHAGNVYRHGWIQDEHEPMLDGKPKGESRSELPIRTCPQCFAVLEQQVQVCDNCGHDFRDDAKERKPKEVEDGILLEIKRQKDPLYRNAVIEQRRVVKTAINKGYKRGWCYHQLVKRIGIELTKKVFPYSSAQFVSEQDIAPLV